MSKTIILAQNYYLNTDYRYKLEQRGHNISPSLQKELNKLDNEQQQLMVLEFWNSDSFKVNQKNSDILSIGESEGKSTRYDKIKAFYGYEAIVTSSKPLEDGLGVNFRTQNGTIIRASFGNIKKNKPHQDYVVNKDAEEVKNMIAVWNNTTANVHKVKQPSRPVLLKKSNTVEANDSNTEVLDEINTSSKANTIDELCPGGRNKGDGHQCKFRKRKGKCIYLCSSLQ